MLKSLICILVAFSFIVGCESFQLDGLNIKDGEKELNLDHVEGTILYPTCDLVPEE